MFPRFFSRLSINQGWRSALIDLAVVIVGILIALQVNNWNNYRISVVESDAAKKTLYQELETAREKLERGLKFNRLRFEKGQRLINGDMESKEIIDDPTNVLYALGFATFDLRLSVTARELTSDSTIIGASELKTKLRDLLENYEYWQSISAQMNDYWDSNILAFFPTLEAMRAYTQLAAGNPIDPNIALELATDQTFLTHLTYINHNRRYLLKFQESVLNDIDSALNLLDKSEK